MLKNQWRVVGGVLIAVFVGACAALILPAIASSPPPDEPESQTTAVELDQQVHALCASCHAFPPPDSLPKSGWQREVEQGYRFAIGAGRDPSRLPPYADVVKYYEARAPLQLPLPVIEYATSPCP